MAAVTITAAVAHPGDLNEYCGHIGVHYHMHNENCMWWAAHGDGYPNPFPNANIGTDPYGNTDANRNPDPTRRALKLAVYRNANWTWRTLRLSTGHVESLPLGRQIRRRPGALGRELLP